MVAKMPQGKSNEDDLVCGGDLRARGNRWLRSAFVSSKLTKVPRENQIRMAVKKLMAKRKMGTMVVKGVFSSCLFKVFGVPPSLIVLCGWVYVEIIQGKILSDRSFGTIPTCLVLTATLTWLSCGQPVMSVYV